ncbi:MAG: SGNH/GDSL hydrolase family protein [Opitutales bacterium]
MKTVPIEPPYIHGAVSLEPKAGGLKPWRIPYQEKTLFAPDEGVPDRAMKPAGVRLRFRTNSPTIQLKCVLEPIADYEMDFDFLVEGERIARARHHAPGEAFLSFERPDAEAAICEIWLPIFMPLQLTSLSVEDDALLEPAPDTRPKWVTYGSSITMCRAAESPSLTWPAVAARKCDLHLTCLGYGGQCHVDSMVARMMRDLPADLITLKLGINVQGQGTLDARSYIAAVIGFIQIIREKHPRTPIGLITPIVSPHRETQANVVGMSLEAYREQNREAFERLRAHGDTQLFLFEGPDVLLGLEDAHLLPDDLHPNGEGYQRMGERAAAHILPPLLAARKASDG